MVFFSRQLNARLAQLVEHPLDVGRVRGSSPLSRTVMIREMTKDDVARVAEIDVFGGRSTYKDFVPNNLYLKVRDVTHALDEFNRWLLNKGNVDYYVYDEDGVIKGYLCFEIRPATDMPDFVECMGLFVEPFMKQQGIGTKLLEFFENKVRERGYSKVYLWTFEKNENARKFYEKNGWAMDGNRMHNELYDSWIVRYSKKLV